MAAVRAAFGCRPQNGKSSSRFTTRPIVTRANMTKTVFAKMEIAQDPMGRCVRTRVNSAEGRLRWPPLGRKRPQRGVVTAKSILKTSAVIRTIEKNLSLMVASRSIWESAPGSCTRDEGGPLVAGLQDLAAKRLALRW
jgi:hypothetical protein